MAIELWAVRHGESVWGQDGIVQGQMDSPLTAKGIRQAEEVGDRLKGISFVVSSDLGRAQQTAMIIAEHLGVARVQLLPCFRERYLGQLQGKPRAEAMALLKLGHSIDELTAIAGLEPEDNFQERIKMGLRWVSIHCHVEKVALITHGGVIRRLYCLLNGVDLRTVYSDMPIENGVPHIFHFERSANGNQA